MSRFIDIMSGVTVGVLLGIIIGILLATELGDHDDSEL